MVEVEIVILTSLKICFLYGAMKPGNILFPLRIAFDWLLHFLPGKWQLELSKPLYDCLFCMSSFWGLIFTYWLFDFSFGYLFVILEVAGLNYLISTLIHWFHDQSEKDIEIHKEIELKEDAAPKNLS